MDEDIEKLKTAAFQAWIALGELSKRIAEGKLNLTQDLILEIADAYGREPDRLCSGSSCTPRSARARRGRSKSSRRLRPRIATEEQVIEHDLRDAPPPLGDGNDSTPRRRPARPAWY